MLLTASCMRIVSRMASAPAQAELFHMDLLARLKLAGADVGKPPIHDGQYCGASTGQLRRLSLARSVRRYAYEAANRPPGRTFHIFELLERLAWSRESTSGLLCHDALESRIATR